MFRYQALNKLMGKAVYTSNAQLGGPDIMYNNGVSHSIVSDDYQGVREILRWLSYVPVVKGGSLPILPPSDLGDTPDRSIEVDVDPKVAQVKRERAFANDVCPTCALLVHCLCIACALLLQYFCITFALLLHYFCITFALLVHYFQYFCITFALLLHYFCPTCALLLPYFCPT